MWVPHSWLERVGLGSCSMTVGLKRYYGRNDLHFVTFSCYRRLPLLLKASARAVVARELARARREYGFLLVGYVVMPEHVHVLMSEPKHGTPSTVLQMLKQRVSRKLRKKARARRAGQLALSFPEAVGELRQFWQGRFYDFNVFTERKKREKLEYMHGNPVSRGLVAHPKEWPWSSWSNYAQRGAGMIEVDLL